MHRESRTHPNMTRETSVEHEKRTPVVEGELLQEPCAGSALTDTDRLAWLMARVCCDEVPGISIPLGLSKLQHRAVFRSEIDVQILKERRG